MTVNQPSPDERAEIARLLLYGEPAVEVGEPGSGNEDLVDFFVRWSPRSSRVETLLLRGEVGTGKTRLARLLWFHRACCLADTATRATAREHLATACKAKRDPGHVIRDPRVVDLLSKFYGWQQQPLPNVVDTLFDGLLFGHMRGAFTGAAQTSPGALTWSRDAKDSVPKDVFLDEVTEVGESIQVKLLGLLSTGEFRPVGDRGVQKLVDRLVFATNRNLEASVASGKFRRDLHHRIASPWIRMRGLDEYDETDFDRVVRNLLAEVAQGLNLTETPPIISARDMDDLRHMKWPGNVRQLEKVIEDFVRSRAMGKVGLRPTQVAEQIANVFATDQSSGHGPTGFPEAFFDEALEKSKTTGEKLTPKDLYARYVEHVLPKTKITDALHRWFRELSKTDQQRMNCKEWAKHR